MSAIVDVVLDLPMSHKEKKVIERLFGMPVQVVMIICAGCSLLAFILIYIDIRSNKNLQYPGSMILMNILICASVLQYFEKKSIVKCIGKALKVKDATMSLFSGDKLSDDIKKDMVYAVLELPLSQKDKRGIKRLFGSFTIIYVLCFIGAMLTSYYLIYDDIRSDNYWQHLVLMVLTDLILIACMWQYGETRNIIITIGKALWAWQGWNGSPTGIGDSPCMVAKRLDKRAGV